MATPANQELSAEIGLDGVVRAGHWTSVTLRMPQSLAEPTRYVAVESQDPDGQWLRSPLVRPALIDETHWAARLLVKIGSRDSIIRAVVLDTMEPDVTHRISQGGHFEKHTNSATIGIKSGSCNAF